MFYHPHHQQMIWTKWNSHEQVFIIQVYFVFLYLCWQQSYSGLHLNTDKGTEEALLILGNTRGGKEGSVWIIRCRIDSQEHWDVCQACWQCGVTLIRWLIIFTISSMEGRCDGSLDQQRVIRLSKGFGRFLMRGGRVPTERKMIEASKLEQKKSPRWGTNKQT